MKRVTDTIKEFPKITKREAWAMWYDVCKYHKAPFTGSLKIKLYDILSEEEHTAFRNKYKEVFP